ncbi:hypothetical protein MCEMIH16_02056 [Caulobacteraceae bacterium]
MADLLLSPDGEGAGVIERGDMYRRYVSPNRAATGLGDPYLRYMSPRRRYPHCAQSAASSALATFTAASFTWP